ncbi:D123 [Ostreococcus tauri]|uniref:D123 n=1 Tax=Ostreococcus tauri TaxID=70448 RepID=A0A090N364_OSTTA|nr:D123 [Ostreococcus tauri]CEF97573.1 D123 [Ostreococcus tauri]|eukprot:XP_022838763.1 D123 [Ostreococcus tauri]
METSETRIPAPTVAELDATRIASWRRALIDKVAKRASFRTELIDVPESFVRYLLADGVACGEEDASLPKRIAQDAFDAKESAERFGEGCEEDDAGDADATAREAFENFTREIGAAIERLGGEVAPKFAWSAPKDATWVTAGNTMKCRNADEVVLLLKASDSVTHDLTEAYRACADYVVDEMEDEEDRAVREHANTALALREWYDLNPSMEFRCFVKTYNLVAVSQRHVNDFYEFLLREKEEIEEAIAEFFENEISKHYTGRDYVFDVYVTPKTHKVKIMDFNVWGGTTLPLLFDWNELESRGSDQDCVPEDERGWTDNVEFRVIQSQGHIRPGLQLGVPFELYDTSEGGAISEFIAMEEQRRRETNNQ